MLEHCFAEINRQLDAQGLVLRRGMILDASVVGATRKDGKPVFGYRFHIGMDVGFGLIRTLAFPRPGSRMSSAPMR